VLVTDNNTQIMECDLSELILSIVIMGLLFVFYVVMSGLIPDDYIYHDIVLVGIYMSGIIYLYKKHPIDFAEELFKPSLLKYAVIGLMVIFLLYLQYYFRIEHEAASEEFTSLYNYKIFGKIAYLILGCIVIPTTEEILFRRYYYNILKNRYGILLGVIISISLFTAAHAFQSLNLYNIVLQGLIYTYVYEKSASIWSSIIVHSFNNSMWFLVTYIAAVQ